jgi:hypothetical protein
MANFTRNLLLRLTANSLKSLMTIAFKTIFGVFVSTANNKPGIAFALHTLLRFFRSLTPASTAATIATSDEGGAFTNSNESDTYEPIEAFQDLVSMS